MSPYVVIMAGGKGERLWPMSRAAKPKHLLSLVGGRTLFQQAVDRLSGLAEPSRLVVVTGADQKGDILRQVPELAPQQVIGEPFGRNTAACVAVAATAIHAKDPAATMVIVTADHIIGDTDLFQQTLRDAGAIAERFHGLVTIGMRPTRPATGYGYIEVGERVEGLTRTPAWKVLRFKEKPDAPTAERFIASGRFFWNAGMFVWEVTSILRTLQQFMPALAKGCAALAARLGKPSQEEALRNLYERTESVPIDIGVMEKADNVFMVEGHFPWDDVGSWVAAGDHLQRDASGSATSGLHLGLDTKGCVIVADEGVVATVGVENLVVVRSGDAVLVCPKARAEEVKALLARMKEDTRFQRFL